MERLEISIINFSICKNILDFRIDASTYRKNYLREEELLRVLGAEPINSIINSIQNFGAYSLCNEINFVDEGIPFLMTQNIRDNYIEWTDIRYVDEKSHKLLYKSHCTSKQVLITMAGEYLGRTAVYDKNFISSSNQAIAKLSLKKGYSPYYVSTFINSSYGQNQINRFKTITGQPNINMGLIKYLKIPVASKELCDQIEHIVLMAHSKISIAREKYNQAENILLKEVGLMDWEPKNENISPRSFKEIMIAGRIDAEYYQPKYDEFFAKLKENRHRPLGKIVTIKKSIEPGSEAYQETGIPFYRVSNLSRDGISDTEIFLDEIKYFKDELAPTKDTILFSKDGSIGVAYKVNNDIKAITSGALLHLNIIDKDILPDYLTLVLNSKIVMMQAERDAGGSVIQHWKPAEIEKVVIPIIDTTVQGKIATLIQESFKLREEGKALLDCAKRAVEVAIKQNEEEGIALLNEKTTTLPKD